MKFPTGGSGKEFARLAPGTYVAVCDQVVALGLQEGSAAFPAPKYQAFLRFQVPGERVDIDRDGETVNLPMTIHSKYTASMNEKATLRKQIESWRGKKFSDEEAADFDVASIAGKACMLSVQEVDKGEKVYSTISGISALPKGMPAPKAEGDVLVYNNDGSKSDTRVFGQLSKWLQGLIEGQLDEDTKPQPKAKPEPKAQQRLSFDEAMDRARAEKAAERELDGFESPDIPF